MKELLELSMYSEPSNTISKEGFHGTIYHFNNGVKLKTGNWINRLSIKSPCTIWLLDGRSVTGKPKNANSRILRVQFRPENQDYPTTKARWINECVDKGKAIDAVVKNNTLIFAEVVNPFLV